MLKYTKTQNDYIIELYYHICDNKSKLSLNNDLVRLFNERFPEVSATYLGLYKVIRQIKVSFC